MKFFKETKTWEGGNKTCVELGEKLFDDLDGTKSQFEFFWNKTRDENQWHAVFTEDYTKWKNLVGDIVDLDLILWQASQANNLNNKPYFVETFPVGFGDISTDKTFMFVCQLTRKTFVEKIRPILSGKQKCNFWLRDAMCHLHFSLQRYKLYKTLENTMAFLTLL